MGIFGAGHLQTYLKVSYIPNLGIRAPLGIPGDAQYKSVKCVFGVRQFVFKRRLAARKANETSRLPHLEAIADIQKIIRYSNSV